MLAVDNDVLYCGMENQPSPAYFSIFFSYFEVVLWNCNAAFSCLFFPVFDFLSFHILNNEIYRQRFFDTVQARMVIFGTCMLVDNDVLWDGEPAISCLFF